MSGTNSPSPHNAPPDPALESLLERLIDQADLEPHEAEAAERVRASQAYRRARDLQRQVDLSLRAWAQAPATLHAWGNPNASPVAATPPAADAAGGRARWSLTRLRPLTAAAAVLVAASLTLTAMVVLFPGRIGAWLPSQAPRQVAQLPAELDLQALFRQQVAAGFEPYWVCDVDTLTRTLRDTLDSVVHLAPASLGEQRRLLGASFLRHRRGAAVAMHGRVENQPVWVILDRAEHADAYPAFEATAQSDGPVHRFEREANGLILIELTPLNAPAFLESFEPPLASPHRTAA